MVGGSRPGSIRGTIGSGNVTRSRIFHDTVLDRAWARWVRLLFLNPTAVVSRRAVWPRGGGSGSPAPDAGAGAATPTTPAPARPATAAPTPASGSASAPPGPSAGSDPPPFPPPRPGRPRPDHRHHGQREQAQGDVPVPAGPTPHLVLVQAAVALGQLEALLDRPARPGDPDQIAQGCPRRSAAGEVSHITGVGRA